MQIVFGHVGQRHDRDALVDRVGDGYSAVYSFFDTSLPRRSLGSFMILWLIELARAEGRRNVYLGFWIGECRKMSYKIAYRPLEGFIDHAWRELDEDDFASRG